MANEPLPNQVPDIALPDLKKKKKERKKSGVAWGNGGTGAEAFEGATGGIGRGAASSAAAAAEGAGEVGAELAGEFGAEFGAEAAAEGLGSEAGFFGRLFNNTFGRLINYLAEVLGSTLAAQAVVGLGAVALLAGAIAAGAYLAGWLGRDGKGNVALNLGGIADNLHLGRGDSSGLDFAKGSGLKFDDGKAGQAAKDSGKGKDGDQAKNGDQGKGGDDGAGNGAPGGQDDNAFGERPNADTLAHNLSGAKLSTGFGNGTSGAFAGLNGGIKPGFSRSPDGFGKAKADHGTAAPLKRAIKGDMHGLNLGRRGIRANRALGQLRAMAPLGSQMTSAATTDEAGQAATTQFEGAQPIGGVAPTSPSIGGTTPGDPGGGTGTPPVAPPCVDSDPSACGLTEPPHVDMTQGLGDLVKTAKQQLDMAKNILLAMGIIVLALEAIAFAWFCTCCAFIGWIFMAIAVIVGLVAVMIAHMLANMVHQQASAIRQAGAALGNDGGKSPGAEDIANQVDKMGDDIGSVNLGILLGGISAFIGFHKVDSDEKTLQQMADTIEQKGDTPVDQSANGANQDKPPTPPPDPKPKPGGHPTTEPQ